MKYICYCVRCKKFESFSENFIKRGPSKCRECGTPIDERYIDSGSFYKEYRSEDDFSKIEASFPEIMLDFAKWSRDRAEMRRIQEKKKSENYASLLKNIVTTDTIPGMKILKICGVVTGTDSYNPAGLIGEGYTSKMGDLYMNGAIETAKKKMIEKARALNANAIVSFKTTSTSSAMNNVIVTATGTAVILEEERNERVVTPSTISIPDEILKYKALCDQGIITNEEFEAKKKQLLNL